MYTLAHLGTHAVLISPNFGPRSPVQMTVLFHTMPTEPYPLVQFQELLRHVSTHSDPRPLLVITLKCNLGANVTRATFRVL